MKNSMKITDRIKLMMSYDNKKTLNENLQENNITNEEETNIDEGPATAKEIGNLFKDASKTKGDFKGITNAIEKDAKLGQSVGSKFNLTVDQVKEALASERGVLNNIDNAIEKEFVSGYRIGKTGVVAKEVQQASQQLALRRVMETGKSEGRVLSEVEIQSIIERTKAETAAKVREYEKNIKGGVIPNPTINYKDKLKASKAELKASKAENARFKEELKNNANQSKESAAGTSAAAAANPALTPEVKELAKDASTVVKDMKPSRYERWKAWAKKNPKTNKALIFLGLTATGWVLYKMFSSNDRKDEVKKTLFANCAGDLLDTQNSQILSMEDGSPVIYVSPTGNKEYDSKKGLKFLSNNRVFSGDNTMRGTWGCKGNAIGVQSEQTGTAADIGINVLTKMAQNKAINKADNVGRVLNKINITWDSKSNGGSGKDNSGGGGGTKSTIPTELKDADGVKKFQTWLDSKHGGWHTKYGTLNNDTLKGWGKYGPNTTKAWGQYKDEYLNGSTASGTETPNPSAKVDVTKPSGIPGSPDMVGKSGLNLDVNRIKVTTQDVSNQIDKEVQPSNTDLTDRQKEILSNVKNRGVDKVYKGGTLTPEEQQWLSKYYGGVVRKIKNEKGYGQKTVIDVPKKDTTSKEPLSEENIIKKIVSKNLKSLIK